MKGAILLCVLFAAVLVSTTTASQGGYISILNSGGYVSFFTVDYTLNGQRRHEETGDYTAGVTRIIQIPAGATEIYVKSSLYWFIGATSDIFSRSYPGPVEKCFKVYGTTLIPYYDEVSC